ncbi:hypothetical protein AAD018_003955 [Aestuariibius insulae]|uniref:hypothetical protein n=1 Tax=Aestuariibius insulae TaxID=2058287 RepID=UPI00345E9029
MRERIYIIAGFFWACAAALAATGVAADGGPKCAERERVIALLAEQYGESRQSIGIAANGSLMEVYASEVTGSWTITVSAPDGPMCLIASGQAYSHLAEALPSRDEGA